MPLINGEFVALEIPEKIGRVLFDSSENWRYRALYGGRGAGKDWSAKAALCEIAIRRPIRVLFARELMASIKDSSHRLIADTIERLGYQQYFTVLDNEIRGKNGSLFTFRGIRHNTNEIKSMEGIDYCVLDEAQPLTEESFNVIDPTIRKKGSEVWFLFNTQMDTDFVYDFCIKNPPKNMISALVNYTDNPYCSQELIDQAEYDKRTNIARYNNKWLGQPNTLGLFFDTFGDHNREQPFVIPEQDDADRLIGALDHGIAHDTSFSLAWLSPDGTIHTIFSYDRNGGTTQSHAQAIIEQIEACRFSRYMYPCEIYYDYAMDTKRAMSEQVYRSDLDEYIDAFAARKNAKDVAFIPANKRKIDGCHSMQLVFDKGNGSPIYRYFDGMNTKTVESIKRVETDTTNAEMYAKMDGDDGADKTRYLVMGALAKMQTLNMVSKKSETKRSIPKREPLTKQYGLI